jgi:hypothetical protein
MVSSLFAGIPFPSSIIDKDGLPQLLTCEKQTKGAENQLRWPASFRNGGRHQIGTAAGIKSVSPAGLPRISHQ